MKSTLSLVHKVQISGEAGLQLDGMSRKHQSYAQILKIQCFYVMKYSA